MERIYYQGTPAQCERAFKQLCAQNRQAGVIPRTGGLIPELPMLDQILYPGMIAGRKRSEILDELQRISPIPVHRLHDLPGWSNERIRAWAVLLRVLIQNTETILVNCFFDDHTDLLPRFIELLPETTFLIYLGTREPPLSVAWTMINRGEIP